MKSLCAIHNGGLGALTIQPMPEDFQDTQAWYDMDYARRQLAASREESKGFYTPTPGSDALVAPAATATAATPTAENLLEEARKIQFLSKTRPGFDYGVNSERRNALFARDSGLSFDFFGAAVESLKKNAPGAFSGIKGGEVLRSIVPNAGGPSLPKVKLPSWLPTINLPRPLQDAANRAKNLAIATAKDVAAKKRAADSASGVASQTSEYPGSPAPDNSLTWVVGGAAILAAVVFATRKK